MTVRIRQASIEDVSALQVYMQELWEESPDTVYQRSSPPSADDERTFVSEISARPNSFLIVASDGDSIVGMLDMHGNSHPQRKHCASFGMSVARPYRRKGIGRALVEKMLDRASKLGLSRIELQVFENNAPAIALYEKLQFKHEGRSRCAVAVNGKLIDMLSMARVQSTISSPSSVSDD